MKSRKIKQQEYREKYNNIPLTLTERLNYMCDKYHVTESKYDEILKMKHIMLDTLYYTDINIILYEKPEGAMRPRSRIITKKNYMHEAITNSQFVHVYSPTGNSDRVYMKRLVEDELNYLTNLISTPCLVTFNAYFETPSYYNITSKFLAEIGLDRPTVKPDWDNIGKKYSDMYNSNIWIDDALTVTGIVNKYYSILPRVEIELRYLNCLYNKYQYNKIINSKSYDGKELQYIDNKGKIQKG